MGTVSATRGNRPAVAGRGIQYSILFDDLDLDLRLLAVSGLYCNRHCAGLDSLHHALFADCSNLVVAAGPSKRGTSSLGDIRIQGQLLAHLDLFALWLVNCHLCGCVRVLHFYSEHHLLFVFQ